MFGSLNLRVGHIETCTTTIYDHVMLVWEDTSNASRMDRYARPIDELNIPNDRSYDTMRGIHA